MRISLFTKTVVLVSLLVFMALFGNAQAIRISGTVTDSVTLKPVPDASIYVANTTIGTKTDENGAYSFSGLSPRNYVLIVSCIGYDTKQVEFNIASNNPLLNVALKPKAILLQEVVIHANNDWKKNLALFKRDFIGTADAGQCKILNENALNLDFDKKANRLTANTVDFLDIENRVLGYKLRFLIEDFWADYTALKTHYNGLVIFEELKGSKTEQKKWVKKRAEVYDGSLRHFLVSLARQTLIKDKFVVMRLIRTPNVQRPPDSVVRTRLKMFTQQQGTNRFNRDSVAKWSKFAMMPKMTEELDKTPVQAANILTPGKQPESFNLQFSDFLYIIYKNKQQDVSQEDGLKRFFDASDFQISAITMKKPAQPILFNSNGILLSKENLYTEGAWNSRIINLLPADYVPKK